MRSKEMQTVLDFCLDNASQASVGQRVLLYRGLAKFCADEAENAQFSKLADDLEAADQRCREFAFQIKNGGAK